MQALLEVRDGDNPRALLGYLPIPAHLDVKVGAVAVFRAGRLEHQQLRPDLAVDTAAFRVRLVVAEYWRPVSEGVSASALAYKAERLPLWLLRRVPGFVEAHTSTQPSQVA